MTITVHLLSQSQCITRYDVVNTYTKDGLFCIQFANQNVVEKYPLVNIFRIKELL